ncbi:MAG: hypothetical protein GXP37_03280 [Chloroflexi bacterium]|nr:hypothetical protein [Chloroflexota bacterium]
MKKYLFLPLLLLLLGACAAPSTQTPDQQATIDAAVQATLAAAPSPAAAASTPEPKATSAAPAQTSTAPSPADSTPSPEPAAQQVIIPPLVNDFDPAPRPASSLGDPDAPVVMYEWSDYT